jgi:predicted DNA-binding transcriptional regulator AlpA
VADTSVAERPQRQQLAATAVTGHPAHGQLPDSLLVFTPEEAYRILRVSRATLFRRVRKGEWPHRIYGDGQGIRFSATDLQQIIDGAYHPAVFTPDEAHRILRISRATLYRRLEEDQWPHLVLGEDVGIRFSADNLCQIIDDATRPAVKR